MNMRNSTYPVNGSEGRIVRKQHPTVSLQRRKGLLMPCSNRNRFISILLLSAICLLSVPFGGFMVTSVSYIVAYNSFDWDHEKSLQFGVGMGVAASVGKELYDVLSGRGHASGKDLVWDGLGIGLGVLVIDALADPPGRVSPPEAGFQGRYNLRQLSLAPTRPLLRTPEFRLSKSVDTLYRVPTLGFPPGGILRPDRIPEGD